MGDIYGESFRKARLARLAFAEGRCELCKHDGSTYRLQAHHAGGPACYERDRRNQLRMQDLLILCGQCHDVVTDRDRRERYAGVPVRPVPVDVPHALPGKPPPTRELPGEPPPPRPDHPANRLPPTR